MKQTYYYTVTMYSKNYEKKYFRTHFMLIKIKLLIYIRYTE